MSEQVYWAAAPDEELAQKMTERARAYYKHVTDTGRRALWERGAACYYGYDPDGGWARASAVTFGGEEGETVLARVNHFGALVRLVHVYISGTRPAFEARAANNDAKSIEHCTLAQTLLDYNLTHGGLEDAALKALLYALRACEGWLEVGWDEDAGEEYATDDTGKMQPSGAPRFEAHRAINVIRDPNLRSTKSFQWLIVRRPVSRWDLIAKYGVDVVTDEAGQATEQENDLAQFLRNVSAIAPQVEDGSSTVRDSDAVGNHDIVYLYELHHPASPALPGGKIALMVGDRLLTPSMPYPFGELPFEPLMPEEDEGSPFGFSPLVDLIAPQSAYDAVISTMLTNHDAHGTQNVWTRVGDDLDVVDLAGGLKNMQSKEMPQPVQLTAISEHSYKLRELIKQDMDSLAAMPSIARGEDSASVKSGSHAALVHSLALQAHSGGQRTYGNALERAAYMTIQRYQEFGKAPRTAELVGAQDAQSLPDFTGEDVSKVQRVLVNLADPITRTAESRKEIADKLFDAQKIDKNEYFDVIKTGRLNTPVDAPANEEKLIRRENERMIAGMPHVAVKTDNPIRHIIGHKSVLDSPETRENPVLFKALADAIDEHMAVWANTPPELLAALGFPPYPGPPPGMVDPNSPNVPPPDDGAPPNGPPPGQGGPPPAQRAQVPGAEQVDQGEMPLMPVNPSTGERAQAGGQQ